MLHALCAAVIRVAAGFEDVVEADEVGLYVHIRMIDRIAHTGLSRKIDDNIRLIPGEDAVNAGLVGHIAADEGEAAAGAFTLPRESAELFKAFKAITTSITTNYFGYQTTSAAAGSGLTAAPLFSPRPFPPLRRRLLREP